MNLSSEQLRQHLPTVNLTAMSIVVALGIERLFDRIDSLQISWAAIDTLVACQILIYVELAVLIWWMSSTWFTTIRWEVTLVDSATPVALLIWLYLLSGNLGRVEDARSWFLVLAAGNLSWIAYYVRVAAKAENDSSNDIARSQLRVPFGLLTGLGLWAALAGLLAPRAGIAGNSLLAAAWGLGQAFSHYLIHRTWKRGLGLTP